MAHGSDKKRFPQTYRRRAGKHIWANLSDVDVAATLRINAGHNGFMRIDVMTKDKTRIAGWVEGQRFELEMSKK